MVNRKLYQRGKEQFNAKGVNQFLDQACGPSQLPNSLNQSPPLPHQFPPPTQKTITLYATFTTSPSPSSSMLPPHSTTTTAY